MLLGCYFRREKFTYWFLSFLPVILVTELWLYFAGTHKFYGEITDIFYYLLLPLSLLTSGVLILVQLISYWIYLVRWCRLTSEQKMVIRDVACNCQKTGKILQSEEVLIYYGMFSKKVLSRKDILSMQRTVNTSTSHVRGGTIVTVSDYIRVTLKSGKKADLMCNIKVLDGYQGELPWNSIGVVVLLGVAELIMGVYPRLIDFFLGEKDVIEKTLFYAGYDWAFWLVAIILITILGIFMVCLKKKFVDESYKGTVTKSPGMFYMALILLLFLGLFFRDKYEDSQLARADLKAYVQGQYEQKTMYIQKEEESQMWGCGSDYMHNYLDAQQIPYACLECFEDGCRWEEFFLLIDPKSKTETEQTYCLYYLENTKIVVGFEQVLNNEVN